MTPGIKRFCWANGLFAISTIIIIITHTRTCSIITINHPHKDMFWVLLSPAQGLGGDLCDTWGHNVLLYLPWWLGEASPRVPTSFPAAVNYPIRGAEDTVSSIFFLYFIFPLWHWGP